MKQAATISASRDHDASRRTEPLNSDFYLKWVRPLGFRDVIGVLVLKSGNGRMVLSREVRYPVTLRRATCGKWC
jgi:hypothetical protein